MRLKSFRRFFFDAEALDRDSFFEALDQHRFEPINPDTEDEADRALGVCQAHAPHASGRLGEMIAEYLCFGIRIDTLRIPAGTLRHHVDEECLRVMEEQKVDTLNRYQRAEIKERVKRELRKKVPPNVAHVLVVLDTAQGIAYVGSTNSTVLDEIGELLEKMGETRFLPESCYARAARLLPDDIDRVCGLEALDLGRALAGNPLGEDEPIAGADYLDRVNRTAHLGATFLLWLWWRSDVQRGEFDVGTDLGAFELWFDDRLVMGSPSVNAQTDTFAGGHPVSSVEALTALRLGKCPALAKLRIVRASQEWSMTLRGVDLAVDGLKVPAVLSRETDEQLCESMILTEQVEDMLDGLYRQFLEARLGAGWLGVVADLLEWIRSERTETA